ncbi:MAG: VCBS repeat-containing protein, partial [bacterium]|nr:VCBS repeat-containing protein [bacterium]
MTRLIIVSFVFMGLVIFIAKGGMSVQKDAIGFVMNDSSYTTFVNQIPPTQMNSYLNFLGVSNLRFATINLPSSNQNNTIYPFNIVNNSTLRLAEARLNNSVVGNAWEINIDNNNNSILTFSRIINDINFQQPLLTNPGGNYIATISWDPNISGSTAWGIAYSRSIYKVYKNGANIVSEQKYTGNESGGISSAIGDFNNDGKADLFVIKTNENDQSPTSVSEAAIFIQGNNETFSKNIINTSSWNQGQTKVDIKWTAGSIVSNFQKYDTNLGKYITEKFDYNNDGKQDVLIASADGAVYAIPNQSQGNTISFGSPIKLVTTGVKTKDMDDTFNGAQVINAGDINKDGIVDIIVGSTDSPKLYIYHGKLDNQGRIYFGGNNANNQSSPDVILYDGQISGSQRIAQRNNNTVESSEYRGPNTQRNSSGNGNPLSEYTGGATNIVLADINRDGELDILIATDNWQFSPTHYKIGNGTNQTFDLSIRHTDRNATISKTGGRVFFMVRNPTTGRYKNYFLGQYAITSDNQNADFDNATIANFSGPTSIDFIATDGNHAQTLFTFLQAGNMYNNADRFIIESKDLIAKGGTSANSFDFNSNSFYIKSITLRITGSFNGIPTSIMVANRIENNNPLYTTIQIPNNFLNTVYNSTNPLTIDIDFYPTDSNSVRYRINNGNWQPLQTNKTRGSSIVYRIEFDTSNTDFKEEVNTLTGQRVIGLK